MGQRSQFSFPVSLVLRYQWYQCSLLANGHHGIGSIPRGIPRLSLFRNGRHLIDGIGWNF